MEHFDISQLESLQPAWLKQMWSPVGVRLDRPSQSEWWLILECLDLRSLASSFAAAPFVSSSIPAEVKPSLFAKAVLTAELDAGKLCAYLGVEVNERRLHSPRRPSLLPPQGAAVPFRKVVQVQLALEHMLTSRPSPHNLTGAEVLEVLLGSISQRLVVGTMVNVFTGPHPIGKFLHTKHIIVQLLIRISTPASDRKVRRHTHSSCGARTQEKKRMPRLSQVHDLHALGPGASADWGLGSRSGVAARSCSSI